MTGLQVSFHDLCQHLFPFLITRIQSHDNPFCRLLKQKGYEPECRRFELDQLRPFLETQPEGCVKCCHAGIVELSAPVLLDGTAVAILFAGLLRKGADLSVDLTDDQPTDAYELWPDHVSQPTSIDDETAQLYLEGLRQLAARLETWLRQHQSMNDATPTGRGVAQHSRNRTIYNFILRNFRKRITLEDLANRLYLSRSRTAHLVREVCGKSFSQLLTDARLRGAMELLAQTDMPISDVADGCGFGDVSNFHKAFKRHVGLSPLKYRQRNHGTI